MTGLDPCSVGHGIRSQHRDALEGMTGSQNRLEKDIAETNGRVDGQHRALKRLADLLKAAMMVSSASQLMSSACISLDDGEACQWHRRKGL